LIAAGGSAREPPRAIGARGGIVGDAIAAARRTGALDKCSSYGACKHTGTRIVQAGGPVALSPGVAPSAVFEGRMNVTGACFAECGAECARAVRARVRDSGLRRCQVGVVARALAAANRCIRTIAHAIVRAQVPQENCNAIGVRLAGSVISRSLEGAGSAGCCIAAAALAVCTGQEQSGGQHSGFDPASVADSWVRNPP